MLRAIPRWTTDYYTLSLWQRLIKRFRTFYLESPACTNSYLNQLTFSNFPAYASSLSCPVLLRERSHHMTSRHITSHPTAAERHYWCYRRPLLRVFCWFLASEGEEKLQQSSALAVGLLRGTVIRHAAFRSNQQWHRRTSRPYLRGAQQLTNCKFTVHIFVCPAALILAQSSLCSLTANSRIMTILRPSDLWFFAESDSSSPSPYIHTSTALKWIKTKYF